jgi:hypothetical protein
MTRITLIYKKTLTADLRGWSRIPTAGRGLLFATIILLLSSLSLAKEKETSVPPPKAIKRTFLKGTDEAKDKLALVLRMIDHSAGTISQNLTVPCITFESVKIEFPLLEAGKPYAVLIFRSGYGPGSCWFDFVSILRKISSEQWEFVATYPLFSRDRHPAITFPSLVKAGQREIMIDRDNIRSGTGDWQYDTVVVQIRDGRPNLIFDEIKELVFAVPAEREGNTEEEENGTFFIVPSDQQHEGAFNILEKQQIKKHKQSVTRWRLFTWAEDSRRFRAEAIDQTTAAEIQKKTANVRANPR